MHGGLIGLKSILFRETSAGTYKISSLKAIACYFHEFDWEIKPFVMIEGHFKSLKKHRIFEKWNHFENRPLYKAYSLCKIVTLGEKLKFKKTCQNIFYKWFTVVLWKKNDQKTLNTREMRPFWKTAIMQSL